MALRTCLLALVLVSSNLALPRSATGTYPAGLLRRPLSPSAGEQPANATPSRSYAVCHYTRNDKPHTPGKASSALAPSDARAANDIAQEETRSYGAQILLFDAIAGMLLVPGFIAASERKPKPEVYLGAAAYALSGPAVHVFHEQYGRAVGSFALRTLPMAGLLAITNNHDASPSRSTEARCQRVDYDHQYCDSDRLGEGLASGLTTVFSLALVVVGGILVTTIDAAGLAKEKVRVQPSVAMSSTAGSFGVTGSF